MNFDLNEDQQLLKDTIDRFLKDHYGFEQRKVHARSPAGWSQEIWSQMAELGLTGLLVPEKHGGFGGGKVEVMVAMEALGSVLALEPFLTTAVISTALIADAGAPDIAAKLLPAIANGKMLVAIAHMERQAPLEVAHVTTSAVASGGAFVLNGEKTLVLHGDSADQLIVSARISGKPDDDRGIGLFVVDAKAAGVAIRGYGTQDSGRAAEISFHNVTAHALSDKAAHDGLPALQKALDLGMAAICVEAVGAMSALNTMTVEYLKIRKQFGVAIGSFQVLQHRAADMYIAIEQARSMAIVAIMSTDEPHVGKRHRDIQAAKVQIGRSSVSVSQEAIQLHGGIAMTMEYAAGHYFKRLTVIDGQWGDADHHLGQLAKGESLFAE